MKTIKELKVGDICYLIDENTVADVKVVNISVSMQTGRYAVEFALTDCGCETEKRHGHPDESVFYSVSGDIYLELEPIIKLLTIKAKSIQKEIDRLKLKADNL